MREYVLLFLGVVIGINISSGEANLLCYSCSGAASAADCNKITTCGLHEECFEEQVIASSVNILYNSGCRSKAICQTSVDTQKKKSSLIACSKCCDNDFCNVGLCDEGAPAGLRCLSCDLSTIHTSDCNHIVLCSEDQNCYSHKALNKADLEPRFETGCSPKLQCEGIARAPLINQCYECCNTSMCNLHSCGLNWTAVYHTSSQPTLTEATTTPTNNIEPDQPVLNRTTLLAYHGDGWLNCTSNVKDVSYTWKLNGTVLQAENGNRLFIQNMTESKMGTYTCVVSKNGATKEAQTDVTIAFAGAHIVSAWSLPVPAQSEKALTIHCEVTGYPVPEVHWSFSDVNGHPYVPPDISYPSYGTAHIRKFHPRSQRGNWTCIAINKYGQDTRVIAIN